MLDALLLVTSQGTRFRVGEMAADVLKYDQIIVSFIVGRTEKPLGILKPLLH